MDAAKSGGQEVRVGEVFVECAEKIGFPGFGFFRQGNNYALRGRRRLPEEKMQLTGSKDGGCEYNDSAGESKMEIRSNFRRSSMTGKFLVDSQGSHTMLAGESRKLCLLLASAGWLALGAATPLTAQSYDTVTVDQSSKNSGSLADALVFGGPITAQLPGSIAGQPRPVRTTVAGTGIASNRNSNGANLLGLDFYTSILGSPGVRMSITSIGLVGIGTQKPTRALEIDTAGDAELGLKSENGTLWTIQSSAMTTTGPTATLSGTFQIIDRNQNLSRLQIDKTGKVAVNVLQINGGSDMAEPFPILNGHVAEGSVVVIDEDDPGRLKLATTAYDTRVAGIISGAGGVKPGLSLQQKGLDRGQNVSLSGRVYVLADAGPAPIRPGDLLTTSDRPGYCMKALDRSRAPGAILGKAMGALDHGQGLILILVSLQ